MDPTLLIVDDHPSFRATARFILDGDGFDVVGEASNGQEALVTAARLSPHVVLLDINLPDTPGFSVATDLVRANAAMRIVLTSNRDPADYLALIESSGAVAFVPKDDLSGAMLRDILS